MIKSPKDTSFTIPMKKKTMNSRDVKFDEEWVWDWKVNDGENYDFLSVLMKRMRDMKIIKNL